MMEHITRWVKFAVGVILVWLIVHVATNYTYSRVDTEMMKPTLDKDTFHLMSYRTGSAASIAKNDIVAYQTISGKGDVAFLQGRVMGLPGDRVRIQDGVVSINDVDQPSTYVAQENRSNDFMGEMLIPADHFFILADNRKVGERLDSRALGPIHVLNVLGFFGGGTE